MFPKVPRIENEALLFDIRKQPCAACKRAPTDAHHVTTKGAGGGDTESNVMPLCREHHTLWHTTGASRMAKRFMGIYHWLLDHERHDIIGQVSDG